MPTINVNSTRSQSPGIGRPNTGPGAAVPFSPLANRVKPQAATGPRVGFLEKFVAMVKSIVRLFRSAPPEGPRLHDPRRDSAAEPLLPSQSFRNPDPMRTVADAEHAAQNPAPAPIIASLEHAQKDDSLLTGALEHARTIGAEPHIHALRAIAAFERDPTVANALAVTKACALLPRDHDKLTHEVVHDRLTHEVVKLSSNEVLLSNVAGAGLRSRRANPSRSLPNDTFSGLQNVLRGIITQRVLPGITTVPPFNS